MGDMSLYRKWRSQTFQDIVSQKHITRTLTNVVNNPRLLAHAYLFAGPRGTGKTSMARIFAKALNCRGNESVPPCNVCDNCVSITEGTSMDVMEIDAASHTSVEMVREYIINKVNFAPVDGKYKIYIIDEAHKLSNSSFNALLKTLEEPPGHVVFILATTDANDLPPTIISRCQKFDFRRISHQDIVRRLRHICQVEGFAVAESALSIIASLSSGSLRDAIVLLEQAASFTDGEITASNISSLLGLSDLSALFSLSQLIAEGKIQELLILANRIIGEGKDIIQFAKDIVEHYRKILLVKVMSDANKVLDLPDETFESYKKAAELYDSSDIMRVTDIMKTAFELSAGLKDAFCQRPLFEIALIKMAIPESETSISSLSARIDKLETIVGNLRRPVSQDSDSSQTGAAVAVEAVSDTASDAGSDASEKMKIRDLWPKIMQSIKAEKMSLHAILADPNVNASFKDSGEILINVKPGYSFHKEQIDKNKEFLKSLICKIVGEKVQISTAFAPPSKSKIPSKEQNAVQEDMYSIQHKELVEEVMDIFQGTTIRL